MRFVRFYYGLLRVVNGFDEIMNANEYGGFVDWDHGMWGRFSLL